jgi:nucleotidyltransferase substrate binding protein (TIGR01987 family)
MEGLTLGLESCRRALPTLNEIPRMRAGVTVRDASNQPFAYSFESLWKLLEVHLDQHDCIVCNSPKRCFREALNVGLLSAQDVETRQTMTDSRNLTSHITIEAIAEAIQGKLLHYPAVMNKLLANIEAHTQ